jgi:DNA-binding HxlR family transcriptional regulator
MWFIQSNFGLNIYNVKYDDSIIEILFKNHSLSYKNLKEKVENYLDRKSSPISDDTFTFHLNRLRQNGEISKEFCPQTNKDKDERICYSLTDDGLKKKKLELKKFSRVYILAFLVQLEDNPKEYDLTQEAIEKFRNKNIDLSTNKLTEIARKDNITAYKPVNCVQVIRDEVSVTEILKPDKKPRTKKENRYSYRILGISADDILHKYVNSGTDDIETINQTDKSSNIVKQALDLLEEKGLITKVTKVFFGSPRYSLVKDLGYLLHNCLSIKDIILNDLDSYWRFIKPPRRDDTKKWLSYFYGPKKANEKIIDFYSFFRSMNRANYKERIEETHKNMKFLINNYIPQWSKKLKDDHMKIIEKYKSPLLSDFIAVTTNPIKFEFFKDICRRYSN